MTTKLELEEIQGLILSGYGERPTARYGLFEIRDRPKARAWLNGLVDRIQFGEYRGSKRGQPPFLKPLCLNVAFTYAGYEALGLPATTLSGFSSPFQEGMCERNRARRLGDDGPSAPENWRWGGPDQPLHGLLCAFAGVDDADPHEWAEIDRCLEGELCAANGVAKLSVLDTMPANRLLRKEHFGFRDGIANPRFKSLSHESADDLIADGEFLLGYENGYGKLPLSPEVPAELDPESTLPATDRDDRHDFGRNGSYLVFRQLSQDVRAFWEYVHRARESVPSAPAGSEGDEWLAAKMVGRWRNGTPLTRYPEREGPIESQDADRFVFNRHDDEFGTRCPIGSHIRRSNPRDTQLPVPHDPELSLAPFDPMREERQRLANLHRLLRRGRPYGAPLDAEYDPERMRAAPPTQGDERGIHFLCFNANLGRQFEFVQSNWLQNPTFAGLSNDPDPLLSCQRQFPFPAGTFTIQGTPTRRVHGLPRFVEMRGGAYFFMPSKRALRYLGRL